MNLLMIIKTSSINYDRRLKKEINTALQSGVKNVKVFALEDLKSKYSKAKVEVYNSDFFFRNFKVLKLLTFIEFIFRLYKNINFNNHSKIWIHDPLMILIIPFIRIRTKNDIIWDLHELPSDKLVNIYIYRFVFRKIANLCNTIIVTNDERGQYLVNKSLISTYEVLHNYPEGRENNYSTYKDPQFDEWIEDKDFAYCQSATHPTRNFFSLAEACVNKRQYLVVVGEKNSIYCNAKKIINKFEDYILVLGKKPSNKLDYYISQAKFSFVFYSGDSKNNYLCAPNRLYNSLKFGVPVITGENPTMKNIIELRECGIVLNGFGESSLKIEESIKMMNESYSTIKKNTDLISREFRWESQSEIIRRILAC